MVVKEPYLVESAISNPNKVSPSNSKNIMMGIMIGLVLSCGYVIILTLVNDRLVGVEKMERVLGYHVLTSFREDHSLSFGSEKKKKGKKK